MIGPALRSDRIGCGCSFCFALEAIANGIGDGASASTRLRKQGLIEARLRVPRPTQGPAWPVGCALSRHAEAVTRGTPTPRPFRYRRRRCLTDDANERGTEMGKIVISENVSSTESSRTRPATRASARRLGRPDRGPPEVAKVALDEALGTEALLLGRRSYEWFAARWPSRSGELADRLNMPKYVVSSTLEDPTGTTRRC